MQWYTDITDDISKITPALAYFECELEHARKECLLKGSVEKAAAELPGIVEHRFRQLQELEAILKYLNILLSKVKSTHYRAYLEGYNRALSSKDAEKFSEGETEVVEFEIIVNSVALVRNKYLAIMKALDQKQWQITNIVKLRVVGLEDATV